MPKPKITRRDVLYVVFLLAWVAISMIVSQYVVSYPMIWILGAKATTPFWTLIYYILNYTLTLFLVFWVPPKLVRLYKVSRTTRPKTELTTLENDLKLYKVSLGFGSWPSFVDLGLAPIAYILYIAVASVITKIISIFPWFDANEAQDVGFNYFATTGDRVCAMIAIVFIAPIAEELIVRGWLYGKVRQKFGIAISMILVSLLFAILHGQLNVGLTTFVLSLALCGLREITGTIWSSMLLHILTNGIAFYLLYVMA